MSKETSQNSCWIRVLKAETWNRWSFPKTYRNTMFAQPKFAASTSNSAPSSPASATKYVPLVDDKSGSSQATVLKHTDLQ